MFLPVSLHNSGGQGRKRTDPQVRLSRCFYRCLYNPLYIREEKNWHTGKVQRYTEMTYIQSLIGLLARELPRSMKNSYIKMPILINSYNQSIILLLFLQKQNLATAIYRSIKNSYIKMPILINIEI